MREVAKPSDKGNGMTYDAELNLLVCEHSRSSIARLRPDGAREVLATHFEGRELNSPNDICVKSDGSIWFSDPWYGRMPGFGVERPRQLGWQGVFRIPAGARAGAEPELMVDRYTFGQPNGLYFCPEESKLYVNDTEQANIRVYKVGPGGRLSDQRIFTSGIRDSLKPGLPDGMKCDAEGNVWLTAPGDLWVYSPDGRLIGKVSTPEMAANLHWGGPDWRTLFVCATTSVYAVDVKVDPRNEPFTRPRASASTSSASPARSAAASSSSAAGGGGLRLDASRCALIIQDMQNDVVMEGGAFASSGSPAHCCEQNAIANAARLADACRARGVPVIHVWSWCRPARAA